MVIRVALIGLSASAKTSWASEAHLPYLLSPRGRQYYQIVALLNSSETAAKEAVKHYNLDPSTKTYGNPQDLANDPEVDLVVCTTRVDLHAQTITPSILASKKIYVEWPLASSHASAQSLLTLTQTHHNTTLIGLQARVSPILTTLHTLLTSLTLGPILSSTIHASTPFSSRTTISPGLAYFLTKPIGGNQITIAAAHLLDYAHSLLGEYASSHAHTQIQFPTQDVAGEKITSDVPDFLSLHGRLEYTEEKPYMCREGASLSVEFRRGPPFPGTKAFVWRIVGEKGEVEVSSARGPFLQSESGDVVIRRHDYESGVVEGVEWEWEEWVRGIEPVRGRNVAVLYDLFARGEGGRLAGFEEAVVRHRQVDEILGTL